MPQPLSHSLIFLTNRVGRLLANNVSCRLASDLTELPGTHIGVLADLWEHDGLRQQDLAISQIKDKATIARAVSAMERQNLVVRIPDENDRRNKRIFLTYQGREMKAMLLPIANCVVGEATTGIDEQDLKTCTRVLAQIYQQLTAEQ